MNKFAAQIQAGNYSIFWVCQCCMLAHANGECCDSDMHGGDGCVPLSKIPDTADVSLGIATEDHADGCTAESRADGDGCECDKREFSWSSCDGCGSTLGGSRFGLFVVYDMREAS